MNPDPDPIQIQGFDLMTKIEENIQHFKKRNFSAFFYFCGSFLPSWIWIRIRNPETDMNLGTPLNQDPIQIHNTGTSCAKQMKEIVQYCTTKTSAWPAEYSMYTLGQKSFFVL
jgi:hypothetical protein